MKIVSIIGARPQFIKASSLSREIAKHPNISEIIVDTGQHFDANMSVVFSTELHLPKPDYNLAINCLSHGAMTGRMLEEIEKIVLKEKPDWLVVYGDTNSTLAGALAAKKLHIKIAHIEAGLRSYNMKMPEEINRVLTDRISDVLFCPTQQAVDNLKKEGYENLDCCIVNVGDIMYDSALYFSGNSEKSVSNIPKNFILATIHRAENTDDVTRLKKIFSALDSIHEKIPVVLPLHPRTKKLLKKYGISTNIQLIDPMGYLEMLYLIKKSKAVITDSGGLQKEAYFFKKQCFTLRDQTEWLELIATGCNQLIDVLTEDISAIVLRDRNRELDFSKKLYGDGKTSERIIKFLKNY